MSATPAGPKNEYFAADLDWNERYTTLPPGVRRPLIVDDVAAGADAELIWRNELSGQTWRIGDRYLKWSPRSAGLDLRVEAARLRWLEHRHPVPRVLDEGHDAEGQWLLTAAIAAESAVSDAWRAQPEAAVFAIAEGLRAIHSIEPDSLPHGWASWATRAPAALGPRPAVRDAVVVHGDACAPNTLVDPAGRFRAHVDVGAVAVADRWADLAVASMALDWNYGPGWQPRFFDAYGVQPDEARIAYYRALWHAES